jgi:hypothetical protein
MHESSSESDSSVEIRPNYREMFQRDEREYQREYRLRHGEPEPISQGLADDDLEPSRPL